jgi:hypothetical protein
VLEAAVLAPVLGTLRPVDSSTSDDSGVVCLDANDGRRSEVRDGDGGRGFGGLL